VGEGLPRRLDERGREAEAHAARAHPAPPEAVAADPHGGVDDRGPETPVGRRAGEEANVRREPGEADEVHGDPLELERDAADGLGARVELDVGERLDGAAVSERVADARVARDALDERGEELRAPP